MIVTRTGMGNCQKIARFQSLLRRSIIYGSARPSLVLQKRAKIISFGYHLTSRAKSKTHTPAAKNPPSLTPVNQWLTSILKPATQIEVVDGRPFDKLSSQYWHTKVACPLCILSKCARVTPAQYLWTTVPQAHSHFNLSLSFSNC